MKMTAKTEMQVLRCPSRKRVVEVRYTNAGHWWAPCYDIVDCPAMHDGPASCERHCRELLGRPANSPFALQGIPYFL
jgi:hypothetical protein